MPGIVDSEDSKIAEVQCRLYRPSAKVTASQLLPLNEPVVLFLHGGGWMGGSPRNYHPFVLKLCRDVDASIVSVDYRLAPEHPFPAGLDDCLAVARVLIFKGHKLILAGDSAGGNLAGAVALELVREGSASSLLGVVMICPSLQAITTAYRSIAMNGPNYHSRTGFGFWLGIYAGIAPTRAIYQVVNADRHVTVEDRNKWWRYVMPSDELYDSFVPDKLAELADIDKAVPEADFEVKMAKVRELATSVRAWPLLAEDSDLAKVIKNHLKNRKNKYFNLIFLLQLNNEIYLYFARATFPTQIYFKIYR